MIYKINTQQIPIVQHRELYSISYNNLEKNLKNNIYIYSYIKLNQFAVYLKLKHYESTILQLKERKCRHKIVCYSYQYFRNIGV